MKLIIVLWAFIPWISAIIFTYVPLSPMITNFREAVNFIAPLWMMLYPWLTFITILVAYYSGKHSK